MSNSKWTPKAIVAVFLGATILLFVVAAAVVKLIGPAIGLPAAESEIMAWKELLVTIIGGLLVWIGTREENGK